MSVGNVGNIKIINKAIPPSSLPLQYNPPSFYGSSKSLNTLIGYKTTPQYTSQTTQANSYRDVYGLTSYTTELDYTAQPLRGSNRDLYSLHTANENVEGPAYLYRQHSIVSAQTPRYSNYSFPHTIVLNTTTSSDLEKTETRSIPNYGKLAWLALLLFFPLGLVALKKHYETRKLRHQNPEKAIAAADVTRFFGTFAILLGIVLYTLAIAIRLRISYQNGDGFV